MFFNAIYDGDNQICKMTTLCARLGSSDDDANLQEKACTFVIQEIIILAAVYRTSFRRNGQRRAI